MPSYYPRPPQVGAGDEDDDGYDDEKAGNVDLKLDNDENIYLSER